MWVSCSGRISRSTARECPDLVIGVSVGSILIGWHRQLDLMLQFHGDEFERVLGGISSDSQSADFEGLRIASARSSANRSARSASFSFGRTQRRNDSLDRALLRFAR
jgi:hypothetical protein